MDCIRVLCDKWRIKYLMEVKNISKYAAYTQGTGHAFSHIFLAKYFIQFLAIYNTNLLEIRHLNFNFSVVSKD
jgi:hypothetical protein